MSLLLSFIFLSSSTQTTRSYLYKLFLFVISNYLSLILIGASILRPFILEIFIKSIVIIYNGCSVPNESEYLNFARFFVISLHGAEPTVMTLIVNKLMSEGKGSKIRQEFARTTQYSIVHSAVQYSAVQYSRDRER